MLDREMEKQMSKPNTNKLKVNKIGQLVALVAGLTLGSTLHADKLSVHLSDKTQQQMDAPKNGQRMAEIEQYFGAPSEKKSPIGEPPISRWIYPDFIVYFENDIVLHTVIKKS